MTQFSNLDSYISSSTRKWLQDIRNQDSSYKYFDDVGLYNRLRRLKKVPKRYLVSEIDSAYKFDEVAKQLKQDEAIKSMGYFAKGLDWAGDIVDALDWKILKTGWERSLTGGIYEALTGQRKFKMDELLPEKDPGVIEDILASASAFIMPLDFLTLGVGGKIGSIVTICLWIASS